MMTREETELSKKFLHAQDKLLALETDRDRLMLAVAILLRRMKKLETVVEGMCIANGAKSKADGA